MKKMKSVFISILGVLLFAVGFYFMKSFDEPQGILKALPYLLIGIGCGAFGHGIGDIFSKWAAKKNPEMAKQMEIDQKDERNIMLANTAKAKGYDIMTYVFGALLMAYALMGASMEIIIPFVIAYLFVQMYAVFIRVKKDKEN
ncbi:hypothetical protein EJP82_16960 [Paenibacillus anaericanus]|uniref:DUF2178 domain-containing protein n=1 Tax=Paenibacillus anaericanus TaxID=170367 RepID=A0A3S1DQ40_9BACL|nr:hypothetical protein [Paenibacillus anaericanus]RUT44651.1 hypothetical protein EJP82_16960 [Paenibacillus anaericanus]